MMEYSKMSKSIRVINSIRYQSGVAIISVLLIVALMTTIIGYAFESQLLSFKRVTNQVLFEQSYQLAMGGEQWALSLLKADLDDPITAAVDHQGETWNNIQEVVKVDVGQMEVEVSDLSGKLNLNSLFLDKSKLTKKGRSNTNNSTPQGSVPINGNNGTTTGGKPSVNNPYPVEFIAGVWMLNNLMLAIEEDTRLVGNLVDWLDPDDSDTAVVDPVKKTPLYIGGAEDFHYTGLERPYRSANQMLKSLGELRYVKGFSDDIIKKLEPYVVVLPTTQLKININTAPEEVLLSMANIPLGAPTNLKDIIEGQSQPLGHESTEALTISATQDEWMPTVAQVVDVKSAFFRVTSKASFDELSYSISSTLFRSFEPNDNGDPESPIVVLRERKIL